MYTQLEASLVRIFSSIDPNDAKSVIGAGFLVSHDAVFTCAHVVTAALGLPDETPEIPTQPILLDFPILASNEVITAHLCFWQPVAPNGGGDICLLRLDSPPPDDAKVARLVVAEKLWGHAFGAIGFPDSYHRDGVSISGELRTRQATGWVQIEGVRAQGFQVQQGFSGGAVWDVQLDGIVGMVVAAEQDTVSKVGYMIPADVLIEAYPPLLEQAIPVCPYRGLFAFREEDAPYFFGRETFTQQLVDAVRRRTLVAVVGSSGSGKSSVVFAGLLPRLRTEGGWLVLPPYRPGNRPFRSLAAVLTPVLEPQMSERERFDEIDKLEQYLQQREHALPNVIERLVQKYVVARVLLVVDQFEELYTECKDAQERQRFLDLLLAAVEATTQQSRRNFNLILTLRADFLEQALTYRRLNDALQQADLKLGPMNRVELEDAIRKPAEQLQVKLADGLVKRLLDDVGQEAGNLPLLEFALTLLWSKQQERTLTHAAYDEIGGVEMALADHAEAKYLEFNEEEQIRVGTIFRRLVHPGEGTGDTRRIATRAEIGEENWPLVARLANERLVITSQEKATEQETVEVIHEALIRRWQRLRNWIEEDRQFLTWRDQLQAALRQWKSSGNDEGALLRGRLLSEAQDWKIQRPEALTEDEQTFIQASQQYEQANLQRDRERAEHLQKLLEEAERQRLEAEYQRQLAEEQRQEAERQREEAQRQQRLAEERRREAEQQRLTAERHRQEAEQQREEAQHQQRLAEERHREAEQQRLTAERHRQEAERQHAEARRQQQIALAQSLAAQAELLRDRYPHLLERSVLLAVEAMQRFPCLETDQPLQHGLDLLPHRLASLTHQDSVTAVAFSPDGRLVATASWDKTAGVWEVPSGRQVARLAHQGMVNTVAFSPDGRLVATASWDKTAGVWEVPSGRQVARLAHQSGVTAVAFSPDGRLVATASDIGDRTAGVWEVSSGRRLAALAHQGGVTAVAFSPDGRLVATASDDGTDEVWEVTSGRRLATFTHQDRWEPVMGSPDGRYSARKYGRTVAFSPDGRLLAATSGDNPAGVWEVSSGRQVAQLAHQSSVYAVAFSPDGQLVATASNDGTAVVWEVTSGRRIASLMHQARVTMVAFSPDGRLVATGSGDMTAGVWEVSSGRQVARLVHQNSVIAVAFSPEGRLVATASLEKSAGVWEVSSGRQMVTLTHQDWVMAVAFSPDGRLLATANDDKSAGVWEVTSGRRVATLVHQEYVYAVAFSPDGRLLATLSGSSFDGRKVSVGMWEVTSGRLVATFAHQKGVATKMVFGGRTYGRAVAFSPDGRLLAAGGNESAGVWEVSSGRQVATLAHQDMVNAVAFSPDGRLLATASWGRARSSNDKSAGVWEVTSGRRLATLAHQDRVSTVAFCPSGRLLGTASDDKTAGVWEVAGGRQIVSLDHDGGVSDVAFSPDGRYLATVSMDVARVWFWRPEDLIVEAQRRLTRNLTEEEWRQYLGDEPYRKTCPNLP